jgi:hypothetical protein
MHIACHLSRQLTLSLTITLLTLGLMACSGGDHHDNTSIPLDGDMTPPTGTSTQTALDKTTPIVIHFSESMKTTSLSLGGSMSAESDSGAWSTTTYSNDTLTLSPKNGSWTSGPNRDLTINATDLAGNGLQTMNLTFLVKLAFDNFQAADVVIGQADFTGHLGNRGGTADANTLFSPYGNPLITSDGKLFISDYSNYRILGYNSLPTANNANADFVVGQPDFTTRTSSLTQGGYQGPQQIVTAGGKFIVSDYSASRIVIYNSIPTSNAILPDVAVGQADFTTRVTTCDAATLQNPETVAATPGGKLIVTDSQHNRVLIWNSMPTTNGQAADIVLGQADFTHCTQNDDNQDGTADAAPTARTLRYPAGIWTDGTKLVVADADNTRVLIWNQIPTASFQPADIVLGQGDFTHFAVNDDNQDGTQDAAPTARTFAYPYDGITSNGVQLAIADGDNNRVLIWNTFPTTNFQPADMVLGQSDFAHHGPNDDNQDLTVDTTPSARTFWFPSGLVFHGDKLLVVDNNNSRALVF